MSKELYQKVRDLIVQDCRDRLYDGNDVSATVLEELAHMMAREIDQVNEPDECVRLVMLALQQAVYYLRDKNLCPDIMRDLEGILETERVVESLVGDPAIDCTIFGNEIERLGR